MSAVLDLVRRGIALLWRYRWTFGVPLATLLLPATLYAVSLPDVYEAKAVVHIRPVRPGSIDQALPQQTMDGASEILSTIRDRLFARDNLKAALAVKAPEADGDDPLVLEGFAEGFGWEAVGSSAFAVARTDESPPRAAKTVNALLEALLEGERALLLEQAERSHAFYERERDAAQEAYEDVRRRLNAFRDEHENTYPDRKDAIEAELRQVQAEITTISGEAGAIRVRVAGLDQQLAALYAQPAGDPTRRTSAAEEALQLQLVEEKRALGAMKHELAEAMSTKTDRHPDVIRLRGAVAVHQSAVAETTAALERVRQESLGRANQDREAQLAYSRKMLLELRSSAEAAWEANQERTRALRARVAELTTWLQEIPRTRAMLDPLVLEEEQAAKSLEASKLAVRDARKVTNHYRESEVAKVTGFQVTAWAAAPVKPSGPGRWRYLLTAVGLGLLAGYGLLLLRRRHEGTEIRGAEDISDLFPAAIVVHVPLLGGKAKPSWPARLREAGAAAYVLVLLGLSVYLFAAHKGWVGAPDWLAGFLGGGRA